MAFISRRSPQGEPAVEAWGRDTDDWAVSHPYLHAFMSETEYDGGGVRKTGTLLLFVDQGLLKACLSDRDVQEVTFVSASSLEGILDRLEGGLREGALEWRKAFGGGKKRR